MAENELEAKFDKTDERINTLENKTEKAEEKIKLQAEENYKILNRNISNISKYAYFFSKCLIQLYFHKQFISHDQFLQSN